MPNRLLSTLKDKLRAAPWLVVFLLAVAPVLFLAPHKAGLALWAVSKIALCAYLGYWIDRTIYPYSRPHTLTGIERGASEKRRSFIIAASIIAGALVP